MSCPSIQSDAIVVVDRTLARIGNAPDTVGWAVPSSLWDCRPLRRCRLILWYESQEMVDSAKIASDACFRPHQSGP